MRRAVLNHRTPHLAAPLPAAYRASARPGGLRMSNRILQLSLTVPPPTPAQAEVRLALVPERLTPTTEVRGRLMGPRCHFSTTVEVAYPFRPAEQAPGELRLRAIVPEPSLWEPQTPFLYEGPVELWQDGARCQAVRVRRGLRALTLGPRGLGLNGRSLLLRGRAVERLDEPEALVLRSAGYNLLVAPADQASLWDLGDRVGFLVLGRLRGAEIADLLTERAGHPSHLGWLLAPGMPPIVAPGSLVGVEAPVDAAGFDFLACPASAAGAALPRGLAVLVLGPGDLPAAPRLLGQAE
jgi:hypothetical protein